MNLSRDFERYAATAVLLLLVLGCYLVVRPFLTAFLWGGIIAVSTRGIYSRLLHFFGQRRRLAAALTGLGMALILLVPIATLGLHLAGQWPSMTERVSGFLSGGLGQPPAWVAGLPLVGKSASAYWQSIAADPERLAQDLRPLVKPVKEFLVAFSSGLGSGILEFALALLIACLLYVRGDDLGTALNQVAHRLGGDTGRRQVAVVESTVRGVFKGVIGTAAAQAILAMIGFWVAGVPGALVLGMVTFFLSVVPCGPVLLWLPAAIWLNANGATGWAIFMGVWGVVVISGSDNVIRPFLIGKGVQSPLSLVFLGVVGGILAFGFLGLFVGPTLLVVAYNLFQDWRAGRGTSADLHQAESQKAR